MCSKPLVFRHFLILPLPPGNFVQNCLKQILIYLSVQKPVFCWFFVIFLVYHFLLEIQCKIQLPLPPIYQCRNFNQKLYYCELSVKRLQIVSQPYYIQISLNFNEKCYYCDLSATRLQSHYIYQTANFQSKWYYCELSARRLKLYLSKPALRLY